MKFLKILSIFRVKIIISDMLGIKSFFKLINTYHTLILK